MTNRRAEEVPGEAYDSEWLQLVAPPDYTNPEPKPRYHIVVIGAGPAGLVTAMAAAGLGARVALVEKERMGGDCLNVGCVPSKALLEYTARADADFDSAWAWMRQVRAKISTHDSVERYSAAGVDVFLGHARFVDDRTVAVGDIGLRGRRIVLATGARPSLPSVPGLQDARPLTNETIFALNEAPKRLAILGAGPIGCELAQVFARVGIMVDLFEVADRILGTESPRAAAVVHHALEAAGITVHVGADVRSVTRRGPQVRIECADDTYAADRVLVAAGRIPNSNDLNLAAVGVEVDDRGRIVVDKHLRTSNRRIFAAGDVCTALQFTHHADMHARIVVQNALFFPTASTTKLVVPRCVYTTPELAQVGSTRAELERDGRAFDAWEVSYGDLDRGRVQGDAEGFIEVLTEKDGARILGATVVGADAGEQLAPICICIGNGIGIDGFGKAMLAYPTRAEALRRIADQYNRTKLTPAVQSVLRRWFRWTG